MLAYRHYQSSVLYTILLGLLCLLFVVFYIQSGYNSIFVVLFSFVIFFIYGFSKMFVFVNDDYIKIRFGIGLYTKRIKLSEVKSVEIVRSKWYHGLGIHYIWKPKALLLSVYGLDAVEVLLKDKKRYRIGTDDAKKLALAIEKRK